LAVLLLCVGLLSLNRSGYADVVAPQIPGEVIDVTRIEGTLRTTFETVGIVVQTQKIVYKLDFSDNQQLEEVARKLNGMHVIVEGRFAGEMTTYGPFSLSENKVTYYFKVKSLTTAG
jgi:hypothetical protein